MDKAIDKRIPRGVIRRRIWGEYIKGADEPWIDQPHSRVRWYVAKKDEDREGTANFIYSARYFCSPVLHNSVVAYLTHLWVCRSWKQDMASYFPLTHRENSCKQMVVILVAVAMTSSHQYGAIISSKKDLTCVTKLVFIVLVPRNKYVDSNTEKLDSKYDLWKY